MKNRQGFVSNSSSSSFICDICGEEVSGMDMTESEAGMCRCQNGHCFCKDHQRNSVKELTTEGERQILISFWKKVQPNTYITHEYIANRIDEIEKCNESDLEDKYSDFEMDNGINPEYCPICNFEKPYVPELFSYLVKKHAQPADVVLAEIKEKFKTYKDFLDFVRS